MPASWSIRSIGRRIVALGTGRVMSQIRMQASRRPRASSASGGVPIGLPQHLRDRPLGVGQRRDVADRQRADDAIGGQFDGQSGPAVVQSHAE